MTIETNLTKRWETGVQHHHRSIEIVTALKAIDDAFGGGALQIKIGGAGDNGENMMYALDVYFEALFSGASHQDLIKNPQIAAGPIKNSIQNNVLDRVKQIVSEQFALHIQEVSDHKPLHEYGADSLDMVEIIIGVEDEFGFADINDEDADAMFNATLSVADLATNVRKLLADSTI